MILQRIEVLPIWFSAFPDFCVVLFFFFLLGKELRKNQTQKYDRVMRELASTITQRTEKFKIQIARNERGEHT